ncbi:MAG: MOSC domain-containing protein [Rhodocyclales bacterium]|nr:MOSC domain-containing protein [Rhodocyclales bacterium]
MAKISLFIGGVRPLPESGRPTGMYKELVSGPLQLGPEGFSGDQQADCRVHGGPEKAVHLYPTRHYARLAAAFPEAAPQLVAGSLGENIATADLDENDVRLGEIWCLGSARLQVCQPRNPCWKIDERFASDGMAAFIAEHQLTGWYWRVLTPGSVAPGDELQREAPASAALTLAEAMRLWHSHRPLLADLQALADTPGIASQWQAKIQQRLDYLRRHPDSAPAVTKFHVKPENL